MSFNVCVKLVIKSQANVFDKVWFGVTAAVSLSYL